MYATGFFHGISTSIVPCTGYHLLMHTVSYIKFMKVNLKLLENIIWHLLKNLNIVVQNIIVKNDTLTVIFTKN